MGKMTEGEKVNYLYEIMQEKISKRRVAAKDDCTTWPKIVEVLTKMERWRQLGRDARQRVYDLLMIPKRHQDLNWHEPRYDTVE